MLAKHGLNHFFRHVWSHATQRWLVAPETAKRSHKGGRLSRTLLSAVGAVSSFVLASVTTLTAAQQAPPVNQLPLAGVVARGVASISQTTSANSALMNIDQSSQRAVINWQSFNVGQNARVNFNQPNASSVTLNNIADQNPSQIFGQIQSNGQVYLSNPNGMLFSPTASVDVKGLVATTHTLDPDAFMAGSSTFARGNATGSIVNQGNLTASLSGYIALLAPNVQNAGVIVAQSGTVALASGDLITLNFNGQGGLAGITTTPSTIASLIENRLAVHAPDGQIIISAVGLSQLQGGVVNNNGVLEANSLTSQGGRITLESDTINLSAQSNISATGATGGGTVLIGGDWQGSADLRAAKSLNMASGASIDASATAVGSGGTVVLWTDTADAQGQTVIGGSIRADGGSSSGDGGRVETSGHYINVNNVSVSTRSVNGNFGTWLLDPSDVTIGSGSDANYTSSSNTYTPNATTTSYVNVGTLTSALASSNVTVTSCGAGGGLGNITLTSNLSWSANTTLTLNAYRSININASISVGGSTSNAGLILKTNQGNVGGDYGFGMTSSGFTGNVSFSSTSATFQTQNYTATALSYTLVNSISTASSIFNSNTSATSATNFALTQNTNANGFTGYSNVRAGTYNGTFAGLGNVISNLTLGSASGTGFFANGNATIRDLAFIGANVTGSSSVGILMGSATTGPITLENIYVQDSKVNATGSFVGGLVGCATYGSGSLTNTYATNLTVNGSGYVGGMIGYSWLTSINGANYYGNVTGNTNYVGGIVGYVATSLQTLTNSLYSGTLSATSNSGGIVGYFSPSTALTVSNLTALGSMSLTSASTNVGGIFGTFYQSSASYPTYTFTGLNASNTITASSSNLGANVGGLIGNLSNYYGQYLTINASSYSGSNLNGTSYVGGLVGYSSANSLNITSSSVTLSGNLTGTTTNSYVGGLVGYATNSYLTNSNATVGGSVIGTTYVGGLAGWLSGGLQNTYFAGNIAATSEYGGLVGFLSGGSENISNSFYNINATYFTVNSSTSNNVVTVGGVYTNQWNEWVNSNSNVSLRSINPDNYFGNQTVSGQKYYLVGANATDFANLLGLSEYNTNYRFALTQNVSMSGSANPYIPYFGGLEFNGNSYTVSNVSVSRQTSGLGLFGYVYGSSIHDLNVSTLSSASNVICGTSYVGALVGSLAYGNVTNVTATLMGNVTGTGNIGGVIGYGIGTLNVAVLSNLTVNSSSSAVAVTGGSYIGGLAGQLRDINATNLTSSAAVSSNNSNVGGLMGYYYTDGTSTAISNANSSGNVTTTGGGNYIGGSIGYFYSFNTPTTTPIAQNLSSSSNISSNSSYVGGLIGEIYTYYGPTTVANLNNGTFTGNLSSGSYSYIGGLVGYSLGYITNSSASAGTFNASASSYVGGLIGYSTQNVTGSVVSTPNINTTGNYVGGLIGEVGSANVTNSTVTSNLGIVTSSQTNLGGLVGWLSSGNVTNATVSGNVGFAGSTQTYVGGLIGYIGAGNLTQASYAAGTVAGGSFVGGLVGGTARNTAGINIANSTTSQNVTATNDFVGGLVGQLGGTLSNSNYSASGAATVTGRYDVGGLVGRLNDTGCITNAYANASINAANNYGGLIGYLTPGATVNNAYYDIDTVNITAISPTSSGSRTLVSGGLAGPRIITTGAIYDALYNTWFQGGALTGINATAANSLFSNVAGVYVLNNNTDLNNYLGYAQLTGLSFKLGQNIDLASLPGYYVPYVGGRFNPNGMVVSNLSLSQYTSNLGFLGYVNGATNNQTITGLEVLNGSITGKTNLGLDAGSTYAVTLNTPLTSGSVTGSDIVYASDPSEMALTGTAGLSNTGGVLGYGYGLNTTSVVLTGTGSAYFATNATVNGGSNVGDLVGRIYNGVVSNLSSSGNVASAGNTTGGLIGRFNNGNVSNVSTTGNVVGGVNNTGGLIGWITSGNVTNATTTGNVTGTVNVTGGLIGYSDSTANNFSLVSHTTGLVKGASFVGGLVGCLTGNLGNSSLAAYDSSVNSTVQSKVSGYYIGGAVGYFSSGNVTNTNVIGSVNASLSSYVGGLIGYHNSGTVSNTTVSANVSGATYVGGFYGSDYNGNTTNSTYTGNVTGGTDVGGFTGYMSYAANVTGANVTANVTASSNNAGGFAGYIYGGNVSNSTVAGNVTGTNDVGGFVGQAYSAYTTAFTNVTSSAAVNATGTYAGGFSGMLESGGSTLTVNISSATGNVTGTSYTGGFAGELYQYSGTVSVNNSSASSKVVGTTQVGGFVGYDLNATVSGSSSYGNVTGTGADVGGFAGSINNGTVNASNAYGNVLGTQDVGGFAGLISGNTTNVSYSSANGNVTNTTNGNTSATGGFVGYFNTTASSASTNIISNSRAAGIVSGTNYVGGFAGVMAGNGSISNDYESGAVIASNSSSGGVGGLAGYLATTFNGTIANVYETGSVTGQSNLGGLIGYAQHGNVSAGYAMGYLTSTSSTNVGAVFGGLSSANTTVNGTTTYAVNRNDLYFDSQTTNIITNPTNVGGGDANATGATALTTAQLQAGLPSNFSAPWTSTAGMFPFLNTIYTSTPTVISGYAYLANGNLAINAQVGIYGGGKLLNSGFVTTGANGYFYEIVSGGVAFASSNLTITATTPLAATLLSAGNVSGMIYSDRLSLSSGVVNLSSGTYTGNLTQGLTQWTTNNLTASALIASINNTVGATNYAVFSGTLPNTSSLLLQANGSTYTQDTALSYAAGGLSNAGTINITSVGNLTLSGANITSSGIESFNAPAIVLGSDINITTTNANVSFNAPLRGDGVTTAKSLTVNTGSGNVTFQGNVGSTSPLAETVNNLTINSTGQITFAGSVDAVNLSTEAGGTTSISGGRVSTSGNQTYLDNLLATSDAVLSGSTITFGSTVTANSNLTVNGNVALNTAAINATGFQNFTGEIYLGTNATLTAGGGITVTGVDSATSSAAKSLTLVASNSTVTLNGSIGTQNALSTLTASANLTTLGIGSDIAVDTVSNILFTGNVQLARSASFNSSSGNLSFQSGVSSSLAKNLTLSSGSGNVSLSQAVTGLGNLSVTGNYFTVGNVQASGNITLSPTTSGNVTGCLSGTAGMVKSGGGRLYLAAADTYSGGTVVNAGLLAFAGESSLGTSSVQVNAGGTVDLSGQTLASHNVTLNGGVLQVNAANASISANASLSANSEFSVTGANLNVSSVLNTGSYGLALTGSGGGFNLTNSSNSIATVASSTSVRNISLNNSAPMAIGSFSVNGVSFSGLNASSDVTVVSTAPITLSASSASTGGNITLVASKFINSAGSTPFNVAATKYWQLWSTNATPFDATNGDQLGGLSSDFTQYNANYGTTQVLGTGNGTLYSFAPQISLVLTGTISKTYDGTANVTLTGANIVANGTVNGDSIASLSATSSAFTDNGTGTSIAGVGTGKTVIASGLNSIVASNNGKPVYGYILQTQNATGTGEITQAPLTLNISKTYDGTTDFSLNNTYTLTGVAPADTAVGLTGAGQVNSANVGSYNSFVTSNFAITNPNYTLSTVTARIDKAPITYTVANATSTYGTLASLGALTLSGVIPSDVGNVTASVSALAANGSAIVLANNTAAGNYTQQASNLSGSAASNYQLASSGNTQGTLTVQPATLTYTVANATSTYGNTPSLGNATLSGILFSDAVNPTVGISNGNGSVSVAANTPAGNYTQQVTGLTGAAASNYQLASSGNTQGVLTVQPATLTYAVANATSTYGTLPNLGALTLSGVIPSDVGNVTASVAALSANGSAIVLANNTAAGNYTQQASNLSGSASSNYLLASSGNTQGTLTIQPATLTYTVANATSTYGTLPSLGALTLSGVIPSDVGNVTASVAALAANGSAIVLANNTAAGNYTQQASNLSGSAASNYLIASSGNTQGTLTVQRAPLTYAVANATSTYGTLASLGALTLSGVIPSDVGNVTANVAALAANGSAIVLANNTAAGNYTQQARNLSGSAASNYLLASSGNTQGTLTVQPATLTYAVANATSTYGTLPSLGALTLSGVIPSDVGNVTASVAALAANGSAIVLANNTAAGNYTQQASNLSGSAASNYLLASSGNTQGTLTVQPAALSITSNSTSKTFGQSYTLNSNAFTANGLVAGDAVSTVVQTASGGTAALDNVGTYTLTPSAASGIGFNPSNYVITYHNGTLTVTPLAVTLNGTKNFDGTTNLQLSATGSSLSVANAVAGASVNVTGSALLASSAPGTENISQFSGLTLDNANYTLSGAQGSVRVLSVSQINVQPLTNGEISGLIASQLANLTSTQVGNLSGTQLQVFSAAQVSALSPSQMSGMSAGQFTSLSPAQVAAITPTQLSILTPQQISGLTSVQLAGMSPTQIQAMSPALLSSLSVNQVLSLTPAQLSTLSGQQLQSLSAPQLNALSATQLAGLSPAQIASLSPAQVSGLTSGQVASLSPTQLAALTSAQVSTLSGTQVSVLTPVQIAALQPQQVAAISSLGNLSPAEVLELTPAQMASVSATQLNQLSMVQVAALSGPQLQSLTATQISGLSLGALSNVTPSQLSSLSTAQLGAMTGSQLSSLSALQIGGLTAQQLQSLNPQQIASLSPQQIGQLSPTQLTSLDANQVQSFSAQQVAGLRLIQVASLTPTQALALTPQQLAALSTVQIAALSAGSTLSVDQINALPSASIAAVSPQLLGTLTSSQVSALDPAQVSAMTPDQLSALGATQFSGLTTPQIAGLSGLQLRSLSLDQIGLLSQDQARGLTATQLGLMTPPQLAALAKVLPSLVKSAAPQPLLDSSGPSAQKAVTSASVESSQPTETVDTYVFSHNTTMNSSGTLPVAVIGGSGSSNVAVQFRQEGQQITLQMTKSDVNVDSATIKRDETATTQSFSVTQSDGREVLYAGTMTDGYLLIAAPTEEARALAMKQLTMVVAAAVKGLSENARVSMNEIKGVMLDLR
jgi:filamentous hemagglutinin family protein